MNYKDKNQKLKSNKYLIMEKDMKIKNYVMKLIN